MQERTIKSDKIFEGKILSLKVDTVEMEGKKYTKREIINHAPCVCILAVDENDEVFMVEQFRKPIEKVICELPAGFIEPCEKPREAAIREFTEETGFRPKNVKYMTEIYSSPGFTDEIIYLFFADEFEEVGQNLDEHEDLKVVKKKFKDVERMIELGEITDSKTIISLMYYDKYLKN